MQANTAQGKSRIPAHCFGWGVFLALLAVLLLTEGRAVAFKKFAGIPEFPNHLLFQVVAWLRFAFVGFGLSLVLCGWLWKPVFSRVLAGDLLESVSDQKIAAGLLLVTLPVYLLLEWFAFQRFPLTPDEFAYLFQAKTLASGNLTAPAHPLQRFFTSAFIAESDGRLFSIMPAGWSFFLVPWVWAGAAWIANPLLSSLSVLLVFRIGKTVYDKTTGCMAALLMAASPFFVYTSGTFFAHPLSLFLVLACTLGAIRLEKQGGAWYVYLLIGLLIGTIPIVRHLDVFLLLPMLALLGLRFLRSPGRSRAKLLLLAASLLLVFAAFTSWYNERLTGSPTRVPHEVYLENDNYLGEIPRHTSLVGISSVGQLKVRIRRLLGQLFQLNLVLFPLAPLLIFVPILLPGRTKWDGVFTCAVLCMFVAYLFYWCRGGLQFGPRYYHPAVGFFCLLIFRAFRALHRCLARRREGKAQAGGLSRLISLAFALVVCFEVGISTGTARMVKDVADYAMIIQDVGGWFARRGIQNSLVFLSPSPEDEATDATKIFLRVRNKPDFSDTNLTASDRGAENRELMDFYPDRRYFLYEIDTDRMLRGEEMRWKEIDRGDSIHTETPAQDS